MPHAIFEPAPPLEELWDAFTPFKEVRDDGTVLEVNSAFLRRDGDMLLVRALVFELGPPQNFFVLCDRNGNQVTVRAEQSTQTPITEGVKQLVAEVARQYRALGGVVTRTNLDLGDDAPDGGGG